MFKDLRPNNTFYILKRGEYPTLETGTVVSVSQPMAKPPTQYNAMFPQQPEMVVDVKVKVGQSTFDFQKLPAGAAIADFAPNGIQNPGQNVVVSTNRDMIKNEIETMLAQSKGIVESVGYHQSVMESCEQMLITLNPTLAKEMQQSEEIQRLKEEMAVMQQSHMESFNEIKRMLLDKEKDKEKEPKVQTPKTQK